MESVKKVFTIINLISKSDQSIEEIAERLNISKSSCYKYLSILKEEGYVSKDKNSKNYKLSNKFIILSKSIINKIDLVNISLPYIEKLYEKTNESIFLAQVFDKKLIYLLKKDSDHLLNLNIRIGDTEEYLYCNALGKVVLSDLPKLEKIHFLENSSLEKRTQNTITDVDKILDELKLTKKRGYALDSSESYEGIICIAAPIYNYTNRVISIMSIASTTIRKEIKELELFKDMLISTCSQISKDMGYIGKLL